MPKKTEGNPPGVPNTELEQVRRELADLRFKFSSFHLSEWLEGELFDLKDLDLSDSDDRFKVVAALEKALQKLVGP